MKNRVITISREFGSGGRTIGKKVAPIILVGFTALSVLIMTNRFTPDIAAA